MKLIVRTINVVTESYVHFPNFYHITKTLKRTMFAELHTPFEPIHETIKIHFKHFVLHHHGLKKWHTSTPLHLPSNPGGPNFTSHPSRPQSNSAFYYSPLRPMFVSIFRPLSTHCTGWDVVRGVVQTHTHNTQRSSKAKFGLRSCLCVSFRQPQQLNGLTGQTGNDARNIKPPEICVKSSANYSAVTVECNRCLKWKMCRNRVRFICYIGSCSLQSRERKRVGSDQCAIIQMKEVLNLIENYLVEHVIFNVNFIRK